MKKLLFLLVLLIEVSFTFGQTQGITYQAVIISDKAEQIPGKDISGNILPNHDIMMRFTILDAAGTIDYQETQATTTDAYGMINLIIGKGELTNISPKTFTEIDWSGEPKSLKVDISFDQSDPFFTDYSLQELNFVPYAYHKNITATGSLKVDGVSSLQDLAVHATTNLNGRVDVNNSSPVHMTGNLHVEDTTVLDDRLYVNNKANFTGQVTIDADINGDQDNSNSFPLVIRGSTQGISIKVDGSKSNANDYLLFYDDGGVQGVIEGENAEDVYTDLGYYIDNAGYIAGVGKAVLDVVGASTSATVCVGIVPCVTTPTPSLIITAAAKLVIAIAQMAAYNYTRFANAGVVYKTKGADYAEWLPKLNPSDVFYPGDIVGIKGGFVTFKTEGADVIMVVSSNPIVLGNTPEAGNESNFVKVAFIGQVPVKVLGVVNAGDYIIANGKNDGGGIAVSPDHLTIDQIKSIVGMAWPNSTKIPLGYANTAVGLNITYVATFDVAQEQKITEQQNTINQLQDKLNAMNDALEQVLPEYAGKMQTQKSIQNHPTVQNSSSNGNTTIPILSKSGQTIIYSDITTDQIREAITMAKQMLREQNFDVDNDATFKKLDTDQDYLNSFVNKLQGTIQKHIDEDYNRNMKAGINVVKMSNN